MSAAAITFQLLLLVYHQTTTLCDFFPFNGVRFNSPREKLLEAGTNLILMSLPLLGFVFNKMSLMKFGVAYYFILFGVECATWWAPYFFGASPKWLEIYQRTHRQTITPLPRRGQNPAPNLEHLILMSLTLVTAIITLIAWLSLSLPFPHWWGGLIIGIPIVSGTLFQFCFQGRNQIHVTRG